MSDQFVVHVMAPRDGVLPETEETHVCTHLEPWDDVLRSPEIIVYHPASILSEDTWRCDHCGTNDAGETDDVFVTRCLS